MFELFLLVIAIENLADIFTNVEWLESARVWFETNAGPFWKLARCKYCQMFWLSLICATVAVPAWIIMTLAIHRLAFIFSEFSDRYINGAPLHLFVQQKKD